jgi:tyrosyl-tRNA synthetase
MDNCIEALRERGLLDDMTSPDLVSHVGEPTCVYAGFDPTSSSLQLGNFVTIMGLAHCQRCGHRVIALVGGATGLIGDPSGKTSERPLLSPEQVAANAEGIRENLSRFLDFDHPTAPALVVNNGDWFKEFTFVEFLRDVGKHFRMGSMLGKESVRSRLDSEAGMSFTEFSYQLLQAYDFLKLFDEHGCRVQIGGSDQWGNITAGIDLVRKLRSREVFGATLPLVCDSAGQKFGKSAGNALFLDAGLTSYYDLYLFFVRTADEDLLTMLKPLKQDLA